MFPFVGTLNLSLTSSLNFTQCPHALFGAARFTAGYVRAVPCQFCGKNGDGNLFWECTVPPSLHVRELLSFLLLLSLDRCKWPRCLGRFFWSAGLLEA